MSRTPILAYHFLPADRRLNYPPRTPVEAGQALEVAPPLELCSRGLHASRRALDALRYAPGPVICRVELSGAVIQGTDKLCATRRRCLALADATAVLHEFACRCAEGALAAERAAGREPDPRSWAAVAAKRGWLHGDVRDDALDAAESAAMSAAESAAVSAARSAAWSAERSAERSAARSAERSAERSSQDRLLESLVAELLGLASPEAAT